MCKLSLERETHQTIGMAKAIPRRSPLSVSSVSSVVIAALEVVCHGSSTEGATKPGGTWRGNPAGGGSFAGARVARLLQPTAGCANLAALATAKIPRHRTSRSF